MLLKLVMKLGGGGVVISGKLKTKTLKDILICSELMRMILVIMFV